MRGSSKFKVQSSRFKVRGEEKLRFFQKPQEQHSTPSTQHPTPSTQPSVAQLLSEAAAELTACKVLNPRLDAEVLLAHILGTQRAGLYTRLHDPLPREHAEAFRPLVHRRAQREPLQYITGVREFWSLEFKVDPRVLIPRPETEVVVEVALRLLLQSAIRFGLTFPLAMPSAIPTRRVLDVGTGSGCIAIALAKELSQAEIWATDVSQDALAVASENAQHHGVAERVRFCQGDMFAPVAEYHPGFDLIVTNPPYIAHDDLAVLQPEVRNWEPRGALDGGVDGLDFYRRLLSEGPTYLCSGGWLVMEIGQGQSTEVMRLMRERRDLTESFCVPDYAGHTRVAVVGKV